MVVIMPDAAILLTRVYSSKYKLPAPSIAKDFDPPSTAAVAGPPSPLNPNDVLFPAMVLMIPDGSILRIAASCGKYILFEPSTRRNPVLTCAAVAGPPSP